MHQQSKEIIGTTQAIPHNIQRMVNNVRQEIFYKKHFVHNLEAIGLLITKLSHHTMMGVTISCVKIHGHMRRNF